MEIFKKQFMNIDKSVNGPDKNFSNRNDYLSALMSENGFDNENEILSNNNFIFNIVKHWVASGQIGCRFAQFFANNTKKYGWTFDTYPCKFDRVSFEDGQIIEKKIINQIKNSDSQVFSMIFPRIESFSQVMNLIESLLKYTNFFIEDIKKYQDQYLISIRYDITGNGNYAWIMFLGPFQNLPRTRQCPFFQIVIRTKKKDKKKMYKLAKDNSYAHNADMPVDMLPKKMQNNFWKQSSVATKKILGYKPDEHSAARYTVSVPNYMWENVNGGKLWNI
ncbi:hypothetical protein [Companilactobacillus metriopterae]|uniref:hypothetical protein n=1 Tax=Companilactobacillus metriopterae TaxID=1909267 RepID=UPI00100BF7D5|nr:hypothetical protein [Companilactobacillus metriopterae]